MLVEDNNTLDHSIYLKKLICQKTKNRLVKGLKKLDKQKLKDKNY